MSYLVSLENVSFKYRDRDDENYLLKDFSISINKGDLILIWGRSGSGKTTILKLLLGLIAPLEGEINWSPLKSRVISTMDKAMRELRRRSIGYLPQEILVPRYLTVEEVLQLESTLRGKNWSDVRARTINILKSLGLNPDRGCWELSLGELQRVGITRALLGDPLAIVLDEPTSHLDSQSSDQLLRLLNNRLGEATLIIASHDPLILKWASRRDSTIIDLNG